MINLFGSKTGAKSISPKEAKSRMETDKSILLIDVRTPEEYREVHIPHSISVPLDNLKTKIEKVSPNKETELFIYCRSGARASTACTELVKMGYTNVHNLGGIMSWPFETERGK